MKRKYTVSDKVLAANRRNLEKANAVPKSIRYRATARRLASCHANLQKAQAAQRDPQHPRRRGQMGHGFHVADLGRTASQAGERLEDLDRHRALFLKAFGGSRQQSRLARALADIFWRRWRALAWEAEREAKQFYGRLAQHPNPESALRPKAFRRQAGRRDALRPIAFRRQAELQTSRALDCLVILAGLVDLGDRLGQLSRRFERLARTWVGLQSDEPVPFPGGTQPSISRIEWEHWKQSEAALSTPFLSSGQVARRLEQSRNPPRALDPPEQWRPWGSRPRRRSCNLSPVTCNLPFDLPADFEAHRERLAAAFGGSAELFSNSAAFLERAAQLSWQRLKLIGEHLEKEQKAVAQLFEAKLDPAQLLARLVALPASDDAPCGLPAGKAGPEPSDDGTPCGPEPTGVRPAVGAPCGPEPSGVGPLMQQAHELERQLQQALYEWLTEQVAPPFRAACYEALRLDQKPVTVASILAELDELDAELDELDKELGLDDEWQPDNEWERDDKAWEKG
jgi:hypothetical protein